MKRSPEFLKGGFKKMGWGRPGGGSAQYIVIYNDEPEKSILLKSWYTSFYQKRRA